MEKKTYNGHLQFNEELQNTLIQFYKELSEQMSKNMGYPNKMDYDRLWNILENFIR